MLQDVNDETPTFRSKSYVGEISENSPRATPILFLGGNVLPEVFDHDSGTNGTFQLFLEGDQGIFEVISFIQNVFFIAHLSDETFFQDVNNSTMNLPVCAFFKIVVLTLCGFLRFSLT